MSRTEKENSHTVMDCPSFDPWTIETFFTPEGKMVSRDLYHTPIRLVRGTSAAFAEHFKSLAKKNIPYYLEFYSPAGELMQAEIRRLALPLEQTPTFDTVFLLVALTPQQVIAFSPIDFNPDFGY